MRMLEFFRMKRPYFPIIVIVAVMFFQASCTTPTSDQPSPREKPTLIIKIDREKVFDNSVSTMAVIELIKNAATEKPDITIAELELLEVSTHPKRLLVKDVAELRWESEAK